jgi:5-methylthioadenosine/S-adenosylhomocysteine deaminase
MTPYTIPSKFLVLSANEPPKQGWGVRVETNRIREVGPNEDIIKKYPDNVLDARNQVIIPGFINTHMHMYSVLTQGTYFKKTWADIHDKLVEFIWREVEDKLNHDAIRAATKFCSAKLIRNGITTVTDIIEAPNALPGCLDVSAEVIDEVGLRGVLMFEATERVNPENGQMGLHENERFIRQNPAGNGRVSGMVSVHTTFSCSLPFLKQARNLADELGSFLHMFISESHFEPMHCMRTYNSLPVEVYDSIGFLKPDVLASLAAHVTGSEIAILAKRGVNIAHIPFSAANPGVGVTPVCDFLAHNINVGLTTYPFFNYFETMRAVILLQRAHILNGGTMPVKSVYNMATEGAARAIGLDDYIGSITKGKFADLLIINPNYTAQITPENLLDLLVFQTNPQDIDTVMIDGNIVMKNSEILTIDEERAKLEVINLNRKLWPVESNIVFQENHL